MLFHLFRLISSSKQPHSELLLKSLTHKKSDSENRIWLFFVFRKILARASSASRHRRPVKPRLLGAFGAAVSRQLPRPKATLPRRTLFATPRIMNYGTGCDTFAKFKQLSFVIRNWKYGWKFVCRLIGEVLGVVFLWFYLYGVSVSYLHFFGVYWEMMQIGWKVDIKSVRLLKI